jgi:predicted ATPase/class 3 adenylate cyclase
MVGSGSTSSDAARPEEPLPTGTVSFLFADIEDATKLLERLQDEYASMLATYRQITGAAVHRRGGAIFGSDGDGIFAAFPDAGSAVKAAQEAQDGYRQAAWPNAAEVKIRMGVHTGTPTLIARDYTGLDVHRAARITAAAWGGQVLLSETSKVLVENEPYAWRDLGWFAMKGLSRPEHLFQMEAGGLPTAFPAPKARPRQVSLPADMTSFIGREGEVANVSRLFSERQEHLVTLTGPGGIGKTRLAVAIAALLDSSYPDGVVFVDLTTKDQPAQVLPAVAAALGVPGDTSADWTDAIVDHLGSRRVLLVLDGFERLLPAAEDVHSVMSRLPGIDLLVSSRAALGLPGEHEFRVAPLGVPDPSESSVADTSRAPAVRLFVERAKAVRPDFELDESSAGVVGELVRSLDGLPLSIEIVAARIRVLSPEALLTRVGEMLDLASPVRDVPSRQKSLRATIEWSHSLLGETEQVLFRRLGVFVAPWTFEAAEAVGTDDQLTDVLSAVETLVNQSLVHVEPSGRISMLSAIREFAREQLASSGEDAVIRDRHADYEISVVAAAEPGLRDERHAETLDRLDDDWADVYAASGWLLSQGKIERAADIVVNSWIYVWQRNLLKEVTEGLELLYGSESSLPLPVRAKVNFITAGLLMELGRYELALPYGLKAVDVAVEAGDGASEAWARLMVSASLAAENVADPKIAEHLDRAIEAATETGELFVLGWVLSSRGSLAIMEGRIEAAVSYQMEGLRVARILNNDSLVAQCLSQAAAAHVVGGELSEARACFDEASEAIDRLQSLEELAGCLEVAALCSFAEGDPVRALTALGCADATRAKLGVQRWAMMDVALMESGLAAEHHEPALREARRTGAEMDPREALAFALEPHHQLARSSS